MTDTPQYQTRVFDSTEAAAEFLPYWSANLRDAESDPAFCAFIMKTRPEIERPYILVVLKDGAPCAMVVGRIENGLHEIKVGYKTLARIKVRRLSIFYGGYFGEVETEAGEVAIKRMLQTLKEEQLHQLVMNGVVWEQHLHKQLSRLAGVFCRDYLSRPIAHHRMTMPASLEELLEKKMNKKHRYWAKRTNSKLEKDFTGGVRLECYSDPAQLDVLFDDIIKVAKKTYQWALGVGFRDSVEQKERLKLEMGKGWTRGYVLYIKDQPVAFWICIVYRDTIYSAYTGYDPEFRKYEVGTALFLRMVGELCREKKAELDFGLGSALYKERFGDIQFEEATVRVYAPRLQSIALNLLSVVMETPVEIARKLLKRFGLEQKLKTAWRSRAIKANAATQQLEPQSAEQG